VNCGKWFVPHNNDPRQKYCNSQKCQRQRKNLWRREKYLPHKKLSEEVKARENERCRESMRKIRSARKFIAAVNIFSGNTITSADIAKCSLLLFGIISFFVGSEDSETVKNVYSEFERRGRLVSETCAKYKFWKKQRKKTVTWTPSPP